MNEIERKHTSARMSKIVCYGNLVYLCGQTASGSDNASANITTQTHETLSRVDALLAEAGTDRTKILSATIYLRDMSDFALMNAAWESWIVPGTSPSRTTVQARLAMETLLVEVTIVAALN